LAVCEIQASFYWMVADFLFSEIDIDFLLTSSLASSFLKLKPLFLLAGCRLSSF
jgi:hypothetical protein